MGISAERMMAGSQELAGNIGSHAWALARLSEQARVAAEERHKDLPLSARKALSLEYASELLSTRNQK